MTTQKDFKRLVRGRMQNTGESYTSARATLLKQGPKRTAHADGNGAAVTVTEPQPEVKATPPADFSKIAGMSDAKLKEKTGCTWERWVWALDAVNAQAWPHKEIAEYVNEKYKVPGWWAQTVTVGYERIRGLRAKGQRRSGSWEAAKSRTIEAPAGAVFKAFKQAKPRAAWLSNKVVVRTAVPNKSVRLTWEDGTSVEVYLTPKGRSKSVVAVQHTKLASRDAADRMKSFWAEHLGALAGQVEKKPK